MRITFAIYLEMSLEARLPGLWQEISQYEFCDSLDPGNFRLRQEIARFECESINDTVDRARSRQLVERAGHRIAQGILAKTLGAEALGDVLVEAAPYHLAVVEVENAPNPESIHGMEGENHSVLCPNCNSPMKQRRSPHGSFWGCSRYPACTGKRAISK